MESRLSLGLSGRVYSALLVRFRHRAVVVIVHRSLGNVPGARNVQKRFRDPAILATSAYEEAPQLYRSVH